MLASLRPTAVKVRNPSARVKNGASKYTGAVRYAVIGSVEGFDPKQPAKPAFRQSMKLALGTESKQAAVRLVEKIQSAYVSGPQSAFWPELKYVLPAPTFQFFADRIMYHDSEIQTQSQAMSKPTWIDLRRMFQAEMADRVEKYNDGEDKGVISPRTQKTYGVVIRRFEGFLNENDTLLESIKPAVIEKYKISRREKLTKNGGSIALDMAVLHRMFAFAIEKELIAKNCINGANETKPGKKPKAPARPLTAEELQKLREAAGRDNLAFLLLRWTGLRGGDAVNLTWADVRFDQGENGEIEVMTQKRRKKAIIPMIPELRTALESAKKQPRPTDFVLCNPYTGLAYSKGNASTNDAGRKKLYERIKELGNRANVDVTPHDLRDTFACDMIARGIDIYTVAMMLADTVSTVEQSYAKFVQAARDAAQHKMVTGIGIEERAKLNREKGRKIVSFPASA